jgi:hypothetical protein
LRPCGAALALVLLACTPEEPGPIRLHRLSRAEYTNSLRDLLGVVPTRAAELPADDPRHGFDNNGDSLTLSPLLLELIERSNDHTIAAALDPSAPHRARLLACDPAQLGPRACARALLDRLTPRAWRRPLRPEEQKDLLARFDAALTLGADFDAAIAHLLHTIFASPYFLYRVERRAPIGERQRLSGHELAARLAAFLWSSAPDDLLLAAAAAGDLERPDRLDHHVRRMLSDPRAAALVDDFGGQWLHFRALDHVFKDTSRYPDFDAPLRDAMREEAARFFASFIAEDRDLRGLLTADYTYADPRLAELYGVPHPGGGDHVRVDLSGAQRRGLLTQAALLSALARPFRTSPSLRGAWIAQNILCAPVAAPPPGVNPNLPEEPDPARDRLNAHQEDPACASCHALIDPLGLALENYDAIGRYRSHDGGALIDPAGRLPSGLTFQGPLELAELLADDPAFPRCVVERALTYALGRGLDADDHAAADAITQQLEDRDYRARELFVLIATSDPFLRRRAEADPEDTP